MKDPLLQGQEQWNMAYGRDDFLILEKGGRRRGRGRTNKKRTCPSFFVPLGRQEQVPLLEKK